MRHATNIRFTPTDLAIIARIRELTGREHTSSVLRIAIREMLERLEAEHAAERRTA